VIFCEGFPKIGRFKPFLIVIIASLNYSPVDPGRFGKKWVAFLVRQKKTRRQGNNRLGITFQYGLSCFEGSTLLLMPAKSRLPPLDLDQVEGLLQD